MKNSAGIIPFRLNRETNEVEFFVGHPGGYGWANKNYWAFLKGHVEEGENWQETAIREFQEESGLTLSDEDKRSLIPLGVVQQNPSKTAIAFGWHYPDIVPENCYSNPIEDDGVTPEMDEYRWVDYNTIKSITHKTHMVFYEKIKQIVEDMTTHG